MPCFSGPHMGAVLVRTAADSTLAYTAGTVVPRAAQVAGFAEPLSHFCTAPGPVYTHCWPDSHITNLPKSTVQ